MTFSEQQLDDAMRKSYEAGYENGIIRGLEIAKESLEIVKEAMDETVSNLTNRVST